MGIKNLWQFLKKYGKQVQFRDFFGKTAAIDASCWLHKALYVSMSQNGNRERCGDIFRAHFRVVKGNGITPFVVFDGLPLPAKASEDERRQRDRENLQSKAEDRNISVEDATKLRSQAVAITFEDITSCISICLSEDVKYIVAPYESDAQIASLIFNGFADFAITEDSDLLAYGCKKVCNLWLNFVPLYLFFWYFFFVTLFSERFFL
ncbi:exonuclease 1-like [Montipora foliosa]|uniref:exonuclease 1-like n=1 Tax=Montipora foliosa TaxID=591990 RepID=UPI0035F18D53